MIPDIPPRMKTTGILRGLRELPMLKFQVFKPILAKLYCMLKTN